MKIGQFVLIVLVIYILYYAVNIIYDLYLKKEKIEEVEEETVNIEGIEIIDNIETVGIDDVEEMKTPNEFASEEDYITDFNNENEKVMETNTKTKTLRKPTNTDFYNILNSASSSVSIVNETDGVFTYGFVTN